MVLNNKGQFFLVALVVLIISIIGIAYFSAEAKTFQVQISNEKNLGFEQMNSLFDAKKIKTLTGTNVLNEMIGLLENDSKQKNYNTTIDCSESGGYPSFNLDCNLIQNSDGLSSTNNFSTSTVISPSILTFSDSDRTKTTRVFNVNDEVFFTMFGPNGNANITLFDPADTIVYEGYETLSDYHADGNLTLNAVTGNWKIMLNYSGSVVNQTINVTDQTITIQTFDGVIATNTFSRGDTVNFIVSATHATEVFLTGVDANGKPAYALTGDTPFSGSFIVRKDEPGNFNLIATGHDYYRTGTKTLVIT